MLGPSVLAGFGSSSTNKWAHVGIGVAMGLIMLVIAVFGIKVTVRVQVSMALLEYLILIGLAIGCLVYVLSHHPGAVPLSRGWLGIDGRATRRPGSWSPCLSTAAGTAPRTSARQSSAAG